MSEAIRRTERYSDQVGKLSRRNREKFKDLLLEKKESLGTSREELSAKAGWHGVWCIVYRASVDMSTLIQEDVWTEAEQLLTEALEQQDEQHARARSKHWKGNT